MSCNRKSDKIEKHVGNEENSTNNNDYSSDSSCKIIAVIEKPQKGQKKRMKKTNLKFRSKSIKKIKMQEVLTSDSDVEITACIPAIKPKQNSEVEIIEVVPGSSTADVEFVDVEFSTTEKSQAKCGAENTGIVIDQTTGEIDLIQNQLGDPTVAAMYDKGL